MNRVRFRYRETKTQEGNRRCRVTLKKRAWYIIYLSDFNRQTISKGMEQNGLEFVPLIDCNAYAYVWKNHPAANRKERELR